MHSSFVRAPNFTLTLHQLWYFTELCGSPELLSFNMTKRCFGIDLFWVISILKFSFICTCACAGPHRRKGRHDAEFFSGRDAQVSLPPVFSLHGGSTRRMGVQHWSSPSAHQNPNERTHCFGRRPREDEDNQCSFTPRATTRMAREMSILTNNQHLRLKTRHSSNITCHGSLLCLMLS